MSVLILGGGKISEDFALEVFHREEFTCVIAVDGGLLTAFQSGIFPTDIVGDFDTVDSELLFQYRKKEEVQIHEYQPEKDATDGQIAMQLAIDKQSDRIVYLGATGGRFDHMFGNVILLTMALNSKIPCCILDEHNRIQLIDQSYKIYQKEQYGKYVSLLPFTDCVKGITLHGFKYPLENYEMDKKNSLTIGISNEIVLEYGEIEFAEGVLILVESKD